MTNSLSNTKWMVRGALTLLLASSPLEGGLIVGDLAIIGVNADNPDEFAWVPFRSLAPGEQIFFSDSGWVNGMFGAGSSDGGLRLTVPTTGIQQGAIQKVRISSLSSAYELLGPTKLGTRFSLSPAGDQLVAFANSIDQPNFLYAVNLSASNWTTTAGSSSNNIRSDLYPGLVSGVTAIAIGSGPSSGDENDNARYRGPTSGTRDWLLQSISSPAQWETTNASGSSDRFADLADGAVTFDIQQATSPAAVPEPASWFVWALTLISITVWYRRFRRPA